MDTEPRQTFTTLPTSLMPAVEISLLEQILDSNLDGRFQSLFGYFTPRTFHLIISTVKFI